MLIKKFSLLALPISQVLSISSSQAPQWRQECFQFDEESVVDATADAVNENKCEFVGAVECCCSYCLVLRFEVTCLRWVKLECLFVCMYLSK